MKKVIAGVVLALALTGCAAEKPTPQSVGFEACDAFAHYLGKADSVAKMERKTTVQQVNMELTKHDDVKADEMMLDGRDILARSVDAPDEQWVLASDIFVTRCNDSGWKVNS